MPTREIYWGVDHHEWLYAVAAVALVVLVYGLVRRWRIIAAGEGRLDARLWPALRVVARDALAGLPLWRRPLRGLAHVLILWGMLALAVGTATVFLEADVGLPVYRGDWYLLITFAMDLLGLLAIAGVLYFLARRLLTAALRSQSTADDWLVLGSLLFILVGGFVLEGLRLAAAEDPWQAWSPVGRLFAAPFGGKDRASLGSAYEILWWTHLLSALALLAWLPFSKLAHVVLAPTQQMLSDPDAGVLGRIDFEDESVEEYGLTQVAGLDRGRRLALEGCTDCGRCDDVCPAVMTGKSLSPRRAVLNLRSALEHGEVGAQVAQTVGADGVWDCLNCLACTRACPVAVQQPLLLLEIRRALTMNEGRLPAEAESALRNLEVNYNPWGFGWADRTGWVRAVGEEEVPLVVGPPGDDGWLLWVGCAGSFDDRAKRIARATARLLHAAGVSFSILGTEEQCCGDPARRMGNEYLFQLLAEHNVEALARAGVRRIVAFCPHCHHVLSREYPDFGGEFEVVHHSELLASLLERGRLVVDVGGGGTLVYHDSCILARRAERVESPRRVLDAMPQTVRLEARRSKSNTFCCGGGGGHAFMEDSDGERISHLRIRELVGPGVSSVATACPFCLAMLEDAAKTLDLCVDVADIAEWLAQALDTGAPDGQMRMERGTKGDV